MLSPLIIEPFIRNALLEDLGHGRDITSEAIIPASAAAKATLRARGSGILAGLVPALSAFSYTDSDCAFEVMAQDGDMLFPGQDIAVIEGPARAILAAERTGLNILMHLSGIATLTAVFVQETKGTKAQITCTRKTLPGMRVFQKYAVRVGGGVNHRHGLDDMILIKDNHIAVAGSIKDALSMANDAAGHSRKIEIEVDSLKQLEQVLAFHAKHKGGVDAVLLDNMSPAMLKKAAAMTKGYGVKNGVFTPSPVLEASGGVNLETVRAIALTGVDYISVGALTHSAPALDIGLDVKV